MGGIWKEKCMDSSSSGFKKNTVSSLGENMQFLNTDKPIIVWRPLFSRFVLAIAFELIMRTCDKI